MNSPLFESIPNPEQPGEELRVLIPSDPLAHIIADHVRKPIEPWGDVIPATELKALREGQTGESDIGRQARLVLREALRKQVFKSAKRPRVIRYSDQDAGATSGDDIWMFLCPTGCQVVAKSVGAGVAKAADALPASDSGELATARNASLQVVSAYFSGEASRCRDANGRWRKVLSEIVYRYTATESARSYHPEPTQQFPFVQKLKRGNTTISRKRERTQIRFVRKDTCGFQAERTGGRERWRFVPGCLQQW